MPRHTKADLARSTEVERFNDRRDFERELLYGEVAEMLGALVYEIGISQRDLAERMQRSESRVSRILNTGENTTLKTIADLGFALGLRIHLTATPLPDREQSPAAADKSLPKWLARQRQLLAED